MHSLTTLPDKNGEDSYIGRSRSATNILIKGFQLYSKANSASIRSSSVTHVSEGDTVSEVDEVNYFAQGRRDEFCICCSMFIADFI
jgi:hypothetical protein